MSVIIFILSACNGGNDSPGKIVKDASGDDNTLLGAGNTFVYFLFSKLFSEYNKPTGLRVNYRSIGSGGGIRQLTNKTVDSEILILQ